MFWLNGLAGTGKSTVAQTFPQICFADGHLGATSVKRALTYLLIALI